MAKNYKFPGSVIDITAAATLTSGQAAVVGTLLAVALVDIANGSKGSAQIDGVFELPKLSTAVVANGAKLHWDVSAGEFIVAATAAGDLENCAIAVAAAGNGATTVLAKLTPGSGALKA
ncbi:DUF2190 family protein [Stenotrophomonas sp. CW117]|uniref:DUF2190 family protein n=1 Tax=Stenotrophomonas TaxID=40323 RepID=UPI00177B2870|nr:capsid cement protein [Stenotrophomonas sp. CW117]QOF99796.1 DUF2190 family protein [Stenotrophomonas sp. CW117]